MQDYFASFGDSSSDYNNWFSLEDNAHIPVMDMNDKLDDGLDWDVISREAQAEAEAEALAGKAALEIEQTPEQVVSNGTP